jgi:hypothetical protein
LRETLLNCGSGVELCEKGYQADVLHAVADRAFGQPSGCYPLEWGRRQSLPLQ